jgi:hypothetical protein
MSMISTIIMFLETSDGPTPLWAWAVGIAIAAAFAIYLYGRGRTRTAALSRIASKMGWKFTATAGDQWLRQQGDFPLFSRNDERSVYYLMEGQIDGAEAAVFDLENRNHRLAGETPSGGSYQTVVSLRSGQLNLPSFSLGPENILRQLAGAVRDKDINFDTHPEFSKRYLLRGQDETAIRSLFNPSLLAFFESFKSGITVAYADRMIYYRDSRKVRPKEFRSFVDEALRVFNQLRDAQAQPQMKLGAAK